MSEKITELEALLRIDKMFADLTEEEIVRILDWISSKYKINQRKHDNISPLPLTVINDNITSSGTDLSLKDFIALKRPENYYERIACFAFYLERYKGMESFKTADITKCNLEARLNKIPNPALYVGDATSAYGYLTAIGGGKKALSIRGEILVDALPDREKVADGLKAHPFKRRTKKSIKKVFNNN